LLNEQENINQIISGCKNKDRRAQELLYRNFYRAMMTICVRYTQNEADAIEVLNTGFYKVYENIHTYDARKATLYTWIRTIVINSCLNFVKARNAKSVWKELDQAASVHLPPDVFAKMSSAEILRLVRQLPPATQAVFNLYVMEGFSHKEIAQMLGISDGTSKWHLSEARRTLQNLITKEEQDT
jgi:RNA polymerase sigma factor (sigma-70 family)